MSSDESDPPSPRNYKRSRPRSRSPSFPKDNDFANGDPPRVSGASPIGGSPVKEFDRASRSRSRDYNSPSRSQSKERSRSRSHSHSHKKHSKSPRSKHRSTSHSPKRKKKHHHHHHSKEKRSYSRSYSRSPSRSRERRHRRQSNSPHYRRRRYSPDRRGYGRPRYNSYNRGYRGGGGPKQRPLKVSENKVIGVFGMSMYTTEKNIEDYFKRYGKIEKVHVILDRQTGNSRGFAFIYFEDINDAIDAKESCDGLELDGRKIRVDYSLTKEPHSPTPGVYMGRKNSRSDDYDYDRRR